MTKQWIARTVWIGMVFGAASAYGAPEVLQTTPAMDGTVSWVSQGAFTTDILYVGNPGSGVIQYAGIMKFDISGVTGPVTAATLELNAWVCTAPGYYLKLEHFTVNNGSAIAYADSISTAVEKIGNLQSLPEGIINQTVSWDITSALNADKAAGFTHSSFRVVLTDATGIYSDFVSDPYNYIGFSSADVTKGYFGPRISIVLPPVLMEGSQGRFAGSPITNDILYVGNPGSTNPMYCAILKFPTPDVIGSITSSTLSIHAWVCTAPDYYVQLEHFTVDNDSPISLSDAMSTQVVPVGSRRNLPDGIINQDLSWDITEFLNADRAAGFSRSSFRIMLVDGSGNYVDDTGGNPNYIGFSSWTVTKGYSGPQISTVVDDTFLPPTGLEGYVGKYSGVIATDDVLWMGNANATNNNMYTPVLKFPLAGMNKTYDFMKLRIHANHSNDNGGGTVNYFKLEHFTVPNDTSISLADATSLDVETVGPVQSMAVGQNGTDFEWEVKSIVDTDKNNGWSHSAFRIVLTDAAGNYLPDTGGAAKCLDFASQEVSGGFPGPRIVGMSQAEAEVSRGHRILLQKGLQIQALAFPNMVSGTPGVIDMARFAAGNFTAVNTWSNPLPGVCSNPRIPRWGRETNGGEIDSSDEEFTPNMISLQCMDEFGFDPALVEIFKNWMIQKKMRFPNTLLYTNQGSPRVGNPDGTAVTIGQLQAFQQETRPDMITMSCYPFLHQGTGIWLDYVGGSPKFMYQDMALYRQSALLGNDGTGSTPIPYGLFLQAFRQWSDGTNNRDASESEMRLQQFAAWTLGYKWTCAYTYNFSDSANYYHTSLFTDERSDANPTSRFTELAETNRQSRNLGPALVRLVSTDVRMILGRNGSGTGTLNPAPAGITIGLAGIDSYITGITAANSGSKNNHLPGDVVVGLFKVLHESLDGDRYSNQKYFMITNGLSDATGSAAETRQTIRVTFNFGSSGITGLQRLSRETGQVELVPLVHESGSQYYLDVTLDGGTGDLFKYNTGSPFVGFFEGEPSRIPGDANGDNKVNVSDLGILAANYGTAANATWATGDFNGDGKVNVSDLGILAARYGTGTGATLDFTADVQALGLPAEAKEEAPVTSTLGCGSVGFPLVAGIVLAGLMVGGLKRDNE